MISFVVPSCQQTVRSPKNTCSCIFTVPIITTEFIVLQGSSTQSTKVVGKSINPHYGANMHFTGVTRDIFLTTSIHAKILGKTQKNTYSEK